MALIYTPEIKNETPMPRFQLNTVDDQKWSSESIELAPAKVIVFMCNHCPYVKAIEDRLIQLAAYLKKKNIPFVGICANDYADYPEDHPKELFNRWKTKNYNFPYLVDADQKVAKLFDAVCTPDFFVFDKNNILKYRGRLDDSWKNASHVTKEELKLAVENIIAGQKIMLPQVPSMGCSIKWKD